MPKTLPAQEGVEQPFMPITPSKPVDEKAWSGMPKTLGSMDVNAPSYQMCACPNGKNIMVQN